MVSFAVWKLLGLIRSHLFILAFVSFALGDRLKKYTVKIENQPCTKLVGRLKAKSSNIIYIYNKQFGDTQNN